MAGATTVSCKTNIEECDVNTYRLYVKSINKESERPFDTYVPRTPGQVAGGSSPRVPPTSASPQRPDDGPSHAASKGTESTIIKGGKKN